MQLAQDVVSFMSLEIEYRGYEIFVERNPDRWQGEYFWSVSKGEDYFEAEIGFDTKEIINDAKVFIDNRF